MTKTTTPDRRRDGFICFVLIVAVWCVYFQVLDHEFINFDDDVYITANDHVRRGLTGESITWAFTSGHGGNWHPLTWISHMVDYELYGLNPGGHHLTSLLLHTANTILLFFLFKKMTGKFQQSAFVAILFAVHPLHVESVAWVSERKDLLSTFFWIVTIGAYVRYVNNRSFANYLLIVSAFVFGLMAKPMLVTLPFVLLLLDYWPLNRVSAVQPFSREVRDLFHEKIPLFGISAVSSIVTFFVQKSGHAVFSLDSFPLSMRLSNALLAYVLYIKKMILPVHMSMFYPHPRQTMNGWHIGGALLLLTTLSVLFLRPCRKRPYLSVGWLWYLGTLVPVIGLVQIGTQAMADRYTYIPLIGLFIMAAWGVPDILSGVRYKKALLIALTSVVVPVFTITARFQAGLWHDSVTLFEHSIASTSGNYILLDNLGATLFQKGETERAINQYSKAMLIEPTYAITHYNMAIAYEKKGEREKAVTYYKQAQALDPGYTDAYYNLGNLLFALEDVEEAMDQYSKALLTNPDHENAHCNLGIGLTLTGKFDDAIFHFKEAIRINPDSPLAIKNLAITLKKKQDRDSSLLGVSK